MRHMRNAIWQRVNNVTEREERLPRISLRVGNIDGERVLHTRTGDQHLPASRWSFADRVPAFTQRGLSVSSYRRLAAAVKRARSFRDSSLDLAPERTDPFCPGHLGELTKVLRTRMPACCPFPRRSFAFARLAGGCIFFRLKDPSRHFYVATPLTHVRVLHRRHVCSDDVIKISHYAG